VKKEPAPVRGMFEGALCIITMFNVNAQSRFFLEQLTVAQMVKKASALQRTQIFITVYTRASHSFIVFLVKLLVT
jgi:hypothetical protein